MVRFANALKILKQKGFSCGYNVDIYSITQKITLTPQILVIVTIFLFLKIKIFRRRHYLGTGHDKLREDNVS